MGCTVLLLLPQDLGGGVGGRAFIAKMNIVDNRMRDEAIEMIFNRTAFENFFQIFASQIRDW